MKVLNFKPFNFDEKVEIKNTIYYDLLAIKIIIGNCELPYYCRK